MPSASGAFLFFKLFAAADVSYSEGRASSSDMVVSCGSWSIMKWSTGLTGFSSSWQWCARVIFVDSESQALWVRGESESPKIFSSRLTAPFCSALIYWASVLTKWFLNRSCSGCGCAFCRPFFTFAFCLQHGGRLDKSFKRCNGLILVISIKIWRNTANTDQNRYICLS